MLDSGERQVASDLSGIRRDHVARYDWASRQLPPASHVLDLGCGIGYGSLVLAEAGHRVMAVDIDRETIEYAKASFPHPNIEYLAGDANSLAPERFDAIVCFEVIEHLAMPYRMLRSLASRTPLLLASVPNEDVFPYRGYKFHHRHYTRDEFERLLNGAGFTVKGLYGQMDVESEVEAELNGRTLVVAAESNGQAATDAPNHVVILGLGPSLESYVDRIKRMGSRRAFADEVWGINAVGDVINCDRIFHMDDVRIQEARAEAAPQSNIARMLEWMKDYRGPIYTSRAHPDYPGTVDYPLADVINSTGFAYFNNTAVYALAFAIHLGVKRISLFGCDYTYKNSHSAEKGRACLEFWIGNALAHGLEVIVPEKSSLLDACEPEDTLFYGYGRFGTQDVKLSKENGKAIVTLTERASLPTAAEIEEAYNHEKSPVNPALLRE